MSLTLPLQLLGQSSRDLLFAHKPSFDSKQGFVVATRQSTEISTQRKARQVQTCRRWRRCRRGKANDEVS